MLPRETVVVRTGGVRTLTGPVHVGSFRNTGNGDFRDSREKRSRAETLPGSAHWGPVGQTQPAACACAILRAKSGFYVFEEHSPEALQGQQSLAY